MFFSSVSYYMNTIINSASNLKYANSIEKILSEEFSLFNTRKVAEHSIKKQHKNPDIIPINNGLKLK